MSLILLLACSADAYDELSTLSAASGLDEEGHLVAVVQAEGELVLAASYLDGVIVERDVVPGSWQLGGPVAEGEATLRIQDPGGQLEVARPNPHEAIVIFRDGGEWRYDCFVDPLGATCESW